MANLKSNGGAVAILRRVYRTGDSAWGMDRNVTYRLAVCRNGVCLIDRGNGAWKRHGKIHSDFSIETAIANLEGAGWQIDKSAGAQAALTHSTTDGQYHHRSYDSPFKARGRGWTRHTVVKEETSSD